MTPREVQVRPVVGRFYADLVRRLEPSVVVEVGTAFGASGMYWLAGLEANGRGRLLTFEPNEACVPIAQANLAAIGSAFELVPRPFEDGIDDVLGDERIDIAFLDGIHTSEWVVPQFELVVDRAAPEAVVVCDDIDFSNDMAACWSTLARDSRVQAAARVTSRVGLLQLA